MTQTLAEIAQELKDHTEKVQLIYAFNGSGKTRLSRAFRNLVFSKSEEVTEDIYYPPLLYYNAFTEDLFSWDNDFTSESGPKLKIRLNYFTDWILKTEGEDQNIINKFQDYTNTALTPQFNDDFTEVTFSYQRGNDEAPRNVKISKGEESCFIWSLFYSFFKEAITTLGVAEKTERTTDRFNNLTYIFIDDPVSSLDENHLIQLAIDIAALIKNSPPEIKFIITTHNPLFYNIIFNETKTVTKEEDKTVPVEKKKTPKKDKKGQIRTGYILHRLDDGNYRLEKKMGDSNRTFSYHLYIKKLIHEAVETGTVTRYHFMLLRNLYEKTASFLGYQKWDSLLPQDKKAEHSYSARIMNFYSHDTLSHESVAEISPQEKNMVRFLLDHLNKNFYVLKSEKND